jgi:hypothetical protein
VTKFVRHYGELAVILNCARPPKAHTTTEAPCSCCGKLHALASTHFIPVPTDGNGLLRHGAIVRIGRKVIIVEDRFFTWFDSQQDEYIANHAPSVKVQHRSAKSSGCQAGGEEKVLDDDLHLLPEIEVDEDDARQFLELNGLKSFDGWSE